MICGRSIRARSPAPLRGCRHERSSTNQGADRARPRLLIDIGPLLVFFLVNFLAPVPGALKIFVATGAFMAAMVAAMIFSAIRYRYISPLLLFSAVMVVVLGGLTIWLHNETFIKIKPTIYYAAGRRPARLRPGDRPAVAQAGARQRLSRPRRGRLAQADPQLGDLLRGHGGASTRRCGATPPPISGSASSCGARSPRPCCSPSPTCRC